MNDKHLLLREARSDDFDNVSRLMRDAYQQYENFLPPEAWKYYVEDMMDVRRRLNESQLIVAELDGRLAGRSPGSHMGINTKRYGNCAVL